MIMKKYFLSIVLYIAFYFLFGCSLDDPAIPLSGQTRSPSPDYHNKPALSADKSQEQGQLTLKSGNRRSISVSGLLALSCGPIPSGPKIDMEISGTGNVTHMGKSKLIIQKTVSTYTYPFSDEREDSWQARADMVLTAANGDELHFYFEECRIDLTQTPVFSFDAECTVEGGTGRFKNAGGCLEYHAKLHWFESTGTLKLEGTVKY